jgi:hypothetical protein
VLGTHLWPTAAIISLPPMRLVILVYAPVAIKGERILRVHFGGYPHNAWCCARLCPIKTMTTTLTTTLLNGHNSPASQVSIFCSVRAFQDSGSRVGVGGMTQWHDTVAFIGSFRWAIGGITSRRKPLGNVNHKLPT